MTSTTAILVLCLVLQIVCGAIIRCSPREREIYSADVIKAMQREVEEWDRIRQARKNVTSTVKPDYIVMAKMPMIEDRTLHGQNKRQATPDISSLMGAGGMPDMQAIQALLSQAGPGVDLSSMGLPDMETIQSMIAQAGGKK